ncbi:MAG: glycerophosphodiester phosphodiesterase [Proteobacteria bacterium]|nr:glycerophosphodiester phosphodiesterase [Pseudomonadota bacterium]
MPGLDWLTARPIAHRGLHNAARGVVENTASAVAAAIDGGYGIEVDLQLSADGEAMVFHDFTLDRLTFGQGPLAACTAAQLRAVAMRAGNDRIMTLGELLERVGGRTTVVLEIKSGFDGDLRLAEHTARLVRDYAGPIAAMSFDPAVVAGLRHAAPGLPRGIVAERRYDHDEWRGLTPGQRRSLAHLLHLARTRPHFIAYALRDLPALAPFLARHVLGMRLLTWTVRTPAERARAQRHAEQMIFEGLRP